MASAWSLDGPWIAGWLPHGPWMLPAWSLGGACMVSKMFPRWAQDGANMVPAWCLTAWTLDGPGMVPGWSLDSLSRAPRGFHFPTPASMSNASTIALATTSPLLHSHSCVYTPPFSCIPDLMADLTSGLATCRTTRTPAPALSTILKIRRGPYSHGAVGHTPVLVFLHNIRCCHLHMTSDHPVLLRQRLSDLHTHPCTHINAHNTYTHRLLG